MKQAKDRKVKVETNLRKTRQIRSEEVRIKKCVNLKKEMDLLTCKHEVTYVN